MPSCRTNITMPYQCNEITVSLDVDFEVERADPSVGIMDDSIADFTAKVIDADLFPGGTPAEVLTELQAAFDANRGDWVEEIEEACMDSLADGREP